MWVQLTYLNYKVKFSYSKSLTYLNNIKNIILSYLFICLKNSVQFRFKIITHYGEIINVMYPALGVSPFLKKMPSGGAKINIIYIYLIKLIIIVK